MTPNLQRTANLLLALMAATLLAACAAGNTGSYTMSAEQRAASMAESGRYEDAAGAYIGLATEATGVERDRLTLLAVEQWLFAGDGGRARSALSQVERPAGGELLWLWSANTAALALWEGRPDRALSLLEPLSRQPLPADHRARVEALRADAWFQKGDPLRAVDLYIQRENWLDDPRTIEAGRERLWSGLQVVDAQSLSDAANVAYDPVARGWLLLGALASSTGQQGVGWGNGVVRWQEMFPEHPATTVLADMSLPQDVVLDYPRKVALLLPLSGNNAAVGSALKNGFLGAYFASNTATGNQQQIEIYDVEQSGGASAAYSQAVLDGAEFVVGPLLRQRVSELASEAFLTVPVLSLNYLPDTVAPPPGFYQFALSPEDEAASAARRAISDDGLRGVALVPANAWGRRVLTSFATEFEGLGGTLVDVRNYEPNAQDFSFEIENVVGLSDSVQRYQRLRANIGGPLQFDPRRREDVDFVFLAADAKAGRLIKSQLKFHYSGDLPVYSTSFVYSMDGRSDSDLDELMFADAPWIVSPPTWIADYPELYREYWPAERRLARLHAMGYDAYNLVGSLFNAGELGMEPLQGATGHLFLTQDGKVHRELAWARFESGKPVALEQTVAYPESADPAVDPLDPSDPQPRPLPND